jgi:hypothetical protein
MPAGTAEGILGRQEYLFWELGEEKIGEFVRMGCIENENRAESS